MNFQVGDVIIFKGYFLKEMIVRVEEHYYELIPLVDGELETILLSKKFVHDNYKLLTSIFREEL